MRQIAAIGAEAWEALCVEKFQSCQLDWAPPSFEAALVSSTRLPNLSLTRLDSKGFGVSRTFAHTRNADADDFMLVLHHSSQHGKLEHNGLRSVLQPKGAVLIDTARPYSFDFSGPVEQTVVKLPRPSTGLLARNAGYPVGNAGSASLRVLATVLRELEQIDSDLAACPHGPHSAAAMSETAREADVLVNSAVELVTSAFAWLGPTQPNVGHEALFRSAQDFVRARLWDPSLGPEAIANHIGCSVRFVSQLFSEQGSSPAAYVRDVRLGKARDLLLAPERQNTAIFDIALRVGFVDATTFARAFRRRYGITPSEFRRER